MAERALRIAATADIHYGKHSRGALHDAFAEASRIADILLFCGDLTDYGLPEEAEELVADIRASVKIPMLAVLGNHDFESGQSELVCKVLDGAGVNVLDGEAIEIGGIGFAGVPGFGGGFGRRMLNAWGEPLIKQFVQESIDHAVRLEQALAKLQTDRKVAVLHYSPIRATLEGSISRQCGLSRPCTQWHPQWCNCDWRSGLQCLGSGGVAEERQAIPDNRIVAKVQACSRFAMGSASET